MLDSAAWDSSMLADTRVIHPTSLISALAKNESIRSVRHGLIEGISGLRLYREHSSDPELTKERERCLRILDDFCQCFIISVKFDKAVVEDDHKLLFEMQEGILDYLSLYTGLSTTLSKKEREEDCKTMKEIQGFIELAMQSKAKADQSDKYIATLRRLYEVIVERTNADQQTTERIILGHDGNL
jgi:hypothetical protein